MKAVDRLLRCMPEEVQAYIYQRSAGLREIRIRVGQPVQVISDEDRLIGAPVSKELLKNILMAATDFSLYCREKEIRQGFFTLSDGCRIGVCGSVNEDGQLRMSGIGSISIRIAREIPGCGEKIMEHVISESGCVQSVLIISAPGMGKTTCLRDCARMLSQAGRRVCVVDERHELAACVNGIPSMDVGERTDVMDGMPRRDAILMLVRAMSPDVLITDEIGNEADADAIADAARCGVSVIASAHAEDFETLFMRKPLYRLISSGVFRRIIRLGVQPGKIAEIRMCNSDDVGGITWVSV